MSATSTEVPNETYTADPVHSTFGFTVVHNGISRFRGTFEKVEATLENGVLTGKAAVDSVKTVIPQLHGHLQSPDFFDAENHPEITFVSKDIKVSGDGSAEVDGDLTIRGVTKPVTATGTFATGVNAQGAEVAGLDVSTTVDRRDFGLNFNMALPNGKDAVAWPVTIEVHLELAKA